MELLFKILTLFFFQIPNILLRDKNLLSFIPIIFATYPT